jgi:thioredoxin reductase
MLDVLVIGGGPAGLQAALTLARGQRRVLVVDWGPPRNARATHLHNFVTRDGTEPAVFRAQARAELARYGVEVRQARAQEVVGGPGDFTVRLDEGEVRARRLLLALGMVDVLPPWPGMAELWGETVFQCPYCHGHEVRGLRWGLVAHEPHMIELAAMARAWTDDVVVLTEGKLEVDRQRLAKAGLRLEERPIAGLRPSAADPGRLGAVLFSEGEPLERDVLLLRPAQRQTELVRSLALQLDPGGYVVLDERRQTSRPGIYAAGDLLTPMQAAIVGAQAGMMAAATISRELALEEAGWS